MIIVIFISIIIWYLYYAKIFAEGLTVYEQHGNKVLHQSESKYQTIDLVQDKSTKDVCMFLNGEIQNHSKEIYKSHYAMVDISIMLYNGTPKNILILGGGDGYPAMRALEYNNLNIKNVEIDGKLVNFVKSNNLMRKLTHNALNDQRVDLYIQDAYEYIYQDVNSYDIIIHDIETLTNNNITEFKPHDNYILNKLLNNKGILNYTDYIKNNNKDIEFQNLFDKYFQLKKKISNKPYFILLLSTNNDFKYFNKYCQFEIIDFKKKYKYAEIGIMIYDFQVKCGSIGEYGEEMYIYLSKEKFNKKNTNIQFYPFQFLFKTEIMIQ